MLTLVSPIKQWFVKDAKKKPLFKSSNTIENRYASSLKLVADEIERILFNTLNTLSGQNGIDAITLLQNYSTQLLDWATDVSSRMIYSVDKDDRKKWERQSKLISVGLREQIQNTPVGNLLKQYLDDNVGLITSMPLEAAKRVHKLILENQISGAKRATSLAEDIMAIGNITRNKAKLIARTETSRIATELTKARAQVFGGDWYVWRTSEDIRVRKSHKKMDGCLVSWAEAPSPERLVGEKDYGNYHAGATFNCRCIADPFLDMTMVNWPARVYYRGTIQRMNKGQFINLFGEVDLLKVA